MTVELKGVHYDISDKARDRIDKKMKRFSYAEEFLTDFRITITHDNNGYTTEANYHFRWGTLGHIKTDNYNLFAALDLLFDKVDNNIQREKEKVRSH